MSTNIEEFLSDLDAGVFAERVSRALSNVAAAVCDYEKKGQVKLTFDIKQTGNHQVHIDHTVEFVQPTKNGKATENNKTTTNMHVGKGGRMTFFPENQHQMFTKQGEPVATEPKK